MNLFNIFSILLDFHPKHSSLDPGISLNQAHRSLGKRVDGRDKSGHDEKGAPRERVRVFPERHYSLFSK